MHRYAVCYTATAGYLFHTVVSAIQSRTHTDRTVEVYICFFGKSASDECRRFEDICQQNDIKLVVAPLPLLGGLHPVYARLFLDDILPGHINEVLYLDGDTLIVGDLNPLVRAEPPVGGALAARDPMVFIRDTSAALRRKIDGWWDGSGIPLAVRDGYINAGVLRLTRADIGPLRQEVVARLVAAERTLQFRDQDAINLALQGRIEHISMGWNFPGFLLQTQFAEIAPPRIIHFMSNPRPWSGAVPPWGNTYHEPYQRFAQRYPEISEYKGSLHRRELIKYYLQSWYKQWTEQRPWRSLDVGRAVRDLEARTWRL